MTIPAHRGSAQSFDSRAWNGVEILRRPKDGFVSATSICRATGKRLNDYLRVSRTHEYIQALLTALRTEIDCATAVAGIPATGKATVAGIPTSGAAPGGSASARGVAGIPVTGVEAVVHVVRGGVPELQGTWIHPRLAVDLARWVSPQFAVWMDGWFLEVMRREGPEGAAKGCPSQVSALVPGQRYKVLPILDEQGVDTVTALFVEAVQGEVADWSCRHAISGYPAGYDDFPIRGLRRYDHASPFTLAPIAKHFLIWIRSSAPGALLEGHTALVPCSPAHGASLRHPA